MSSSPPKSASSTQSLCFQQLPNNCSNGIAVHSNTSDELEHPIADLVKQPITSGSAKHQQSPTKRPASRLLRRAFSMPRNLLRLSSRKLMKVNDGININDEQSPDESKTSSMSTTIVLGGGTNNERHSVSSTGSYTRTNETHAKLLNTSCNNVLDQSSRDDDDGPKTPQQQQHLSVKKRRAQTWRKVMLRLAQMVNIGTKNSHTLAGAVQRVPSFHSTASAKYLLDFWPADQIPGVTGLKNHGNTCFMNAVLQCLSHTDILAEYFVLDQYKVDLKRRNKLTSRKFGTKGELTEQLALVLKALWTCKLESDWSTTVGFKAVVDRYGTQFRSAQQHDAQEFLFWLLDKVHEDLNTAPKRKYKSIKNTFGRPDSVLAAETLANHVRGNRSFVQAVFQAQFRSSLACPQCHRQSNTFDPFHCISVQLPQQHVRLPVFVTVRYAAQHPRQVQLGMSMPAGAPVSALRAQLQTDTGIPGARMVLVEIANELGFGRVLADSYTLDAVTGADGIGAAGSANSINVYCMETPSASGQDDIEREARKCDGLLTVLVTNASRSSTDTAVRRFGTPFCLEIRRDVTYAELQKRLLKEMQHVLRPDVFAYSVAPADMFRMRLQDPSADIDAFVESRCEHPLFMEMFDLALIVLAPDAGPPHVKLLLEWSEPERFFADMADEAVEHESVTAVRQQAEASMAATGSSTTAKLSLEQCLEHYTRAETLGAEDAWRCPHCQQYLPVVKTLGIWSLPEILVIHFKRFAAQQQQQQQMNKSSTKTVPVGRTAAKLTTAVTFPLVGFDMTPHLAQQPSTSSTAPTTRTRRSSAVPSTSSSFDNTSHTNDPTNLYDLYAVCYHQGETLETGHYTAACRNPYDQQWYRFDDQNVTAIPNCGNGDSEQTATEIVNNEAYILFYQRRVSSAPTMAATVASTSTGSSSAESTAVRVERGVNGAMAINGSLGAGLSTTAMSEHWVSRIAPVPPVTPVSPNGPAISQSQHSLAMPNENSDHEQQQSETVSTESKQIETDPVEDPVITPSTHAALSSLDTHGTDRSTLAPEIAPTADITETANRISSDEQLVITIAHFEQLQFAEFCQQTPTDSNNSEQSVSPTPSANPIDLQPTSQPHLPKRQQHQLQQTINRGNSFSEVFRRRGSPVQYQSSPNSRSSGGVNRYSDTATTITHNKQQLQQQQHHHQHRTHHHHYHGRFLSESDDSGSGDGSGAASYLLVDNRSASWVS